MRKRPSFSYLLFCLPVFLLFLSVYVPYGIAAEINVHSGYSIQTAINVASNGDIIVVHPGTYYENIDFKGKAIILRSKNPNDLNRSFRNNLPKSL